MEVQAENQPKQKKEIKIENKEEAIKSLEALHITVYNRMKGKGLSIIENLANDSDELKINKDLYIQYITSISNDISNTIKRAMEYLK